MNKSIENITTTADPSLNALSPYNGPQTPSDRVGPPYGTTGNVTPPPQSTCLHIDGSCKRHPLTTPDKMVDTTQVRSQLWSFSGVPMRRTIL